MTRKELLQIPGLGGLIQSLNETPAPAGSLIPPRPHCTTRFAEPGDVWRVIEATQQTEDQDYSPTNPHCSTVVILKREDELAGEHAVYRVAPVLADIRYCGVEDAIFPREVFGYEAAVACGCEFTLTSKELDRCEGSLPEKWFDQLAAFGAWMDAEVVGDYEASGIPVGEVEPAFPPLLKTGRPFTHSDDPGYIFHAKLAANLQPLMATVLEELFAEEREPVPFPHQSFFESLSAWLAELFPSLALEAAHSDDKGDEVVKSFLSAADDPYKAQLVHDRVGRWFLRVSTANADAARVKLRVELAQEAPVLEFLPEDAESFFAQVRLSESMAEALKTGHRPVFRPAE